jgi:phosphate transport system ATP-binding protein
MNLVEIRNVNIWYGKNQALKSINLSISKNCIYSLIGPSGCGKTTLLRSINRLNDFVPGFRLTGSIEIDGVNAYLKNEHAFVENLRRDIGMVFQHTNPLPMTILQNMLLPVREHYKDSRQKMYDLALEKMKEVAIYDEVADRLHKTAMKLSGGQQQRLCIARALMLKPKLLLMDEPCSALDPISTFKIEELLMELKKSYTIIMVTHNMEQARRIADYTAFFYRGEIIETGETLELFSRPKKELTQNYLTGRF